MVQEGSRALLFAQVGKQADHAVGQGVGQDVILRHLLGALEHGFGVFLGGGIGGAVQLQHALFRGGELFPGSGGGRRFGGGRGGRFLRGAGGCFGAGGRLGGGFIRKFILLGKQFIERLVDTEAFTVGGEKVESCPVDLSFMDWSTNPPSVIYEGETVEAIEDKLLVNDLVWKLR